MKLHLPLASGFIAAGTCCCCCCGNPFDNQALKDAGVWFLGDDDDAAALATPLGQFDAYPGSDLKLAMITSSPQNVFAVYDMAEAGASPESVREHYQSWGETHGFSSQVSDQGLVMRRGSDQLVVSEMGASWTLLVFTQEGAATTGASPMQPPSVEEEAPGVRPVVPEQR